MKLALNFILFLSSLHLMAADNIDPVAKNAVSIISKLNQNKLLAAPCSDCLQEAPKISKALLNKCAVDLCGPTAKNKTVWLTDTNFSKNIPSDTLKKANKLTSNIEALFDVSKNKKLEDINELKNILKAKAINIPADHKLFLDENIFGPYIDEHVRLESPVENRIEIKLKNTEKLSPNFLKALKNYAQNLEASKISNVPSDYRQIFSEKELNTIVKLNLDKIQTFQKKNTQQLSKLDLDGQISALTTKLNKKMTYEEFDLAMMSINYISSAFYAEVKKSPLSLASCEILECGSAYFEELKIDNIKDKINKLERWLNSNETKNKAVNKCKARIIAADTKASDAHKSAQLFSETKKAVNEKVLTRFSEHSRKILSDYLNNQLKASNIDINQEILTPEDPFVFFKKASETYLDKNSAPNNYTILETIAAIQEDAESLEAFDYLETCGGQNPTMVWDAFLPAQVAQEISRVSADSTPASIKNMKNDHVFISTFSCEHGDHGKHYLAHEIGHALNSIFANGNLSASSMADYNKLRNCAVNNYGGDTTYAEEDTADLFANMASPNDTNIYTCAFLKPNFDNTSYESLSLYSPPGDTHSSPLTRIILEATNRNLLIPDSCQEIINNEKLKIRLNKCI